MIAFLILPFLSFLAILLQTTNASAAPTPAPSPPVSHTSDSGDHSPPDPTAIRHSPAQISAFLHAHNTVREKYHAKPLQWSTTLAQLAEQWADACNFKPTKGVLSDEPYGENIVAGTGNFSIDAAVGTFVQDEDQFNPFNPAPSHFTQVVWQNTTDLGCALSLCNGIFPGHGPATLYVCLYSPPGNIIDEVLQNVHL